MTYQRERVKTPFMVADVLVFISVTNVRSQPQYCMLNFYILLHPNIMIVFFYQLDAQIL